MFFNLFKKKNWQRQTVPSLHAEDSNLSVTLKNLTCLVDADSGRIKFIGQYGYNFCGVLEETFENSEKTSSLFNDNNDCVTIGLGSHAKIKKEVPDISNDHCVEIKLKNKKLIKNINVLIPEILELTVNSLNNRKPRV